MDLRKYSDIFFSMIFIILFARKQTSLVFEETSNLRIFVFLLPKYPDFPKEKQTFLCVHLHAKNQKSRLSVYGVTKIRSQEANASWISLGSKIEN